MTIYNDFERRLRSLERLIQRVPLRDLPPQRTPAMIQIIGGQTLGGVPVIQYAADPFTASATYNPDVDVTYDIGLGNAWMYNLNGQATSRVLVRHSFQGNTDPVMQGGVYIVSGSITLAVSSAGTPPGSPTTGSKYSTGSSPTGAWAGHPGATAVWDGSAWSFTDGAPAAMVAYTIRYP